VAATIFHTRKKKVGTRLPDSTEVHYPQHFFREQAIAAMEICVLC
jgi:hypothetical protein